MALFIISTLVSTPPKIVAKLNSNFKGALMNKKQFIGELATRTGSTKVVATELLDAVKSIIKEQLAAGNEVSLGSDFGTFKPTNRAGKAPGTGKPYSTNLVKFSISAPFKRELNK